MFQVVSSNPSPQIASLRVRYHATSSIEADDIFANTLEDHIVPVGEDEMPYREFQDELPSDERPVIKKFRSGNNFRLSVYNFNTPQNVPLIGFNVETIHSNDDRYVEGSEHILDPSKARLTRPAIATIPLLYLFNAQVTAEAKRTAHLLTRQTSEQEDVVSLSAKADERMMDAALIATHNVMTLLYGNSKSDDVPNPTTGQDSLIENLSFTLDANRVFYETLMKRMHELFMPSIRTLAEGIALNKSANTAPIKLI